MTDQVNEALRALKGQADAVMVAHATGSEDVFMLHVNKLLDAVRAIEVTAHPSRGVVDEAMVRKLAAKIRRGHDVALSQNNRAVVAEDCAAWAHELESNLQTAHPALDVVDGAKPWDGALFERAYGTGYRAALGAAAAECRRLSEAVDHGGNHYSRQANASQCEAAILGLRAPSIESPTTDTSEAVGGIDALEGQAAALPAVPEGESVTLTVAQIADLARFAGLTLAQPPQPTADELEAQITVCECPDTGVLLDGEDADPGLVAHYTHTAYYSEYPDEGCIGLGPELVATPKDQPAQGEG